MAAKRGRTITSFGQLFGSLSGGQQVVVTGVFKRLTLRERSLDLTLEPRETNLTLKERPLTLTLEERPDD